MQDKNIHQESQPKVSKNGKVVRLRPEEVGKLNRVVKFRQRDGVPEYTWRDALTDSIVSHDLTSRKAYDLDLLILIDELENRLRQLTNVNAELVKLMVMKNMGVVENLKSAAKKLDETH